MMTGPVGSPLAAVMQESFGCSVANRFHQLLDDESDPFDVLREAERRQQQRKRRDEAAAAGGRAVPGARAGGGRRETQKERRQPESAPAPAPAEPPRAGTLGGPGGAGAGSGKEGRGRLLACGRSPRQAWGQRCHSTAEQNPLPSGVGVVNAPESALRESSDTWARS